jgi:hypothetical protein
VVISTLATAASAAGQAGEELLFPNPVFYSGFGSRQWEIADLNGDGHHDIVVRTSGLIVMLGQGDGTFIQHQGIGITASGEMALADLDADGHADAFNVSRAAYTWFRNDGQGTLASGGTGVLDETPSAFVLQDLNGDGAADLVAYDLLDGPGVAVYLNDGAGNFAASVRLGIDWQIASFAAMDVDADGDTDIIGFNRVEPLLHVLNNDGSGALSPSEDVALSEVVGSVVVTDYDSDGTTDLVLRMQRSNEIELHAGDGMGGFAPPRTLLTLAVGARIGVADFDADGRADLLSTGSPFRVHRGLPDGTLGDPAEYRMAGNFVRALDLNGDGFPEIIALDTDRDEIGVLINDGAGSFVTSRQLPLALDDARRIRVVDVNADGHLDALVAHSDSPSASLSVLIGDGSGRLTAAGLFPCGNGVSDMQVGDLNGDGNIDAVIANRFGDTLVIMTGNGQGQFAVTDLVPTGSSPTSIALGDLDGDGDLDTVAVCERENRVDVALNNGFGNLMPRAPLPISFNSDHVELADADQDGRLDAIITPSGQRHVSVMLGDGAGSFGPQTRFDLGSSVSIVTLGDLNGDGRPDAIATNGDQAVIVLLGRGDGGFGAPASYAAGEPITPLALRDVDGDAALDLVAGSFYGVSQRRGVVVMRGDGNGGFISPAIRYASTSYTRGVGIGDLDGDGVLDLAAVNDSQARGLDVLPGIRTAPRCRPDFDGDGALTVFDFLAFFTAFDAGDMAADFDGDGRLTIFDFLAFQTAFDAGCP